MEDISRELEREIARSKPSPHKSKRTSRVLIVDDFGQMKSGGHLRVLVCFFAVVSFVSLGAAGGLYYYYSGLSSMSDQLRKRVTELEKKSSRIASEKELLLAKLVIAGKSKELDLKPRQETIKKEKMPVKKAVQPKKKTVKKEKPKKKELADLGSGVKVVDAPKKEIKSQIVQPATALPPLASADSGSGQGRAAESPGSEPLYSKPVQQNIGIEKFEVTRNEVNGKLVVKFDIRNISKKPGGVSGRIFTILKPEDSQEEDWVVVPKVQLKDGVPAQYRKGQYFSISRFKPIKFTVDSQVRTELLKTATVYVFNEQGQVMHQGDIDIAGVEKS